MTEMTAADHAMIDRILAREGGFVNNPLDKGGATNKGITLNTLSDWLGHPATLEEVRAITGDTARQIYFSVYMDRPGLTKVNNRVYRELLFDAAVQHGPTQAVKQLQRALMVVDDGVIGPRTMWALDHAVGLDKALIAERLWYYGAILHRNPSQTVFAAGWFNRVAQLLEDIR